MPVRALLDDDTVLAPVCDELLWERVRAAARSDRDRVRTGCCGWPAVPRTSKLGTRHFAHRPGADCRHPPETVHHVQLKTLLVQALHARGWQPVSEAAGDGWRADVLAGRDGERLAFEVQWSAQDAGTTLARTRRYADAGVRVVWLMRRVPPELAGADVVCVPVTQDEPGAYRVAVGGQDATVAELVDLVLDDELALAPVHVPGRQTQTAFVAQVACDRCGEQAVAALDLPTAELRGRCGFPAPVSPRAAQDLRERAVGDLNRALRAGEVGTGIPGLTVAPGDTRLGDARWRSSCRACGAEADPLATRRRLREAHRRGDATAVWSVTLRVSLHDAVEAPLHWCRRRSGCAPAPLETGGERTALLLERALADLRPRSTPAPATVAGTAPATLVHVDDLGLVVTCQAKPLHATAVRVQAARLAAGGQRGLWVTTDGRAGAAALVGLPVVVLRDGPTPAAVDRLATEVRRAR